MEVRKNMGCVSRIRRVRRLVGITIDREKFTETVKPVVKAHREELIAWLPGVKIEMEQAPPGSQLHKNLSDIVTTIEKSIAELERFC